MRKDMRIWTTGFSFSFQKDATVVSAASRASHPIVHINVHQIRPRKTMRAEKRRAHDRCLSNTRLGSTFAAVWFKIRTMTYRLAHQWQPEPEDHVLIITDFVNAGTKGEGSGWNFRPGSPQHRIAAGAAVFARLFGQYTCTVSELTSAPHCFFFRPPWT